jgi:hypothetical protein
MLRKKKIRLSLPYYAAVAPAELFTAVAPAVCYEKITIQK